MAWREGGNGKKGGMGKKGDLGGVRDGVHTHRCPSESAGVKHGWGAPPINHRNKRLRVCCSLLTADSAAGMGEDCNN